VCIGVAVQRGGERQEGAFAFPPKDGYSLNTGAMRPQLAVGQ
jgi:hypothetical protein